jgi:hypothetical protein
MARLLLTLLMIVWAQLSFAKVCTVKISLTAEKKAVTDLNVNDPEEVWIKQVFTEQIQVILEGIQAAGLEIADEEDEGTLKINLDYLRDDRNLIEGIDLTMDAQFQGKYTDRPTVVHHKMEKELSYLSKKGLKKSSKKLTKEIEKAIYKALKILQQQSGACL